MADEWRAEMLETLPYLRAQSFVRKAYKAYRPGWAHDHCAVCGVKLIELGAKADGSIQEGYATTSEYRHGEDYEWVCTDCFSASKELMGWIDAS